VLNKYHNNKNIGSEHCQSCIATLFSTPNTTDIHAWLRNDDILPKVNSYFFFLASFLPSFLASLAGLELFFSSGLASGAFLASPFAGLSFPSVANSGLW
jgi:hypothetical protein